MKNERMKVIKLDAQLQKRKELLKKDIMKKRAQLEKELTLEIHEEIRREQSRKRKMDSESESVTKKKIEIEKLYCVCKTPYDDTKYVRTVLASSLFHLFCHLFHHPQLNSNHRHLFTSSSFIIHFHSSAFIIHLHLFSLLSSSSSSTILVILIHHHPYLSLFIIIHPHSHHHY